VIGRFAVALCGGELKSTSLNVRGVNIPDVVGVPPITPVAEFNVKPGGSEPVFTDQVYGSVPPVAVKVAEYGTFTVPSGSETVVICGGAGKMVIGRVAIAICGGGPESFTRNRIGVNVPYAVGVPLITPFGFKVKPGGRAPAINCHV
jgi:hypothetical protein